MIINANIDPNIQPVSRGGTGKTTIEEARQNINYIGTNCISSPNYDTVENWATLGTGYVWEDGGKLLNQPARGCVENVFKVTRAGNYLVTQKLHTMSGDYSVYHRTGDLNTGWFNSWTKLLDENYVPDILSIYNSQQTVFSTTKSVIAFDTVEYSTTDKLGMSNNGIKILSDKVNKIKVSALLRLNPNTTSTCGIYVYMCKNDSDLTNFSSISYSGVSVALSIADYFVDVKKDDVITFKMLGSVANTARLQAGSLFTVEVVK